MPMCLTISWVYTVAMLVQNIVYEKEKRLKEVYIDSMIIISILKVYQNAEMLSL